MWKLKMDEKWLFLPFTWFKTYLLITRPCTQYAVSMDSESVAQDDAMWPDICPVKCRGAGSAGSRSSRNIKQQRCAHASAFFHQKYEMLTILYKILSSCRAWHRPGQSFPWESYGWTLCMSCVITLVAIYIRASPTVSVAQTYWVCKEVRTANVCQALKNLRSESDNGRICNQVKKCVDRQTWGRPLRVWLMLKWLGCVLQVERIWMPGSWIHWLL